MDVDINAKIIWDYMKLNQPLEKADCILVLGSHDIRSAEYATELFLKGYAPRIVFSGGVIWSGQEEKMKYTEAEAFSNVARAAGVPESSILMENRATNTEENFVFSEQLLKERGL